MTTDFLGFEKPSKDDRINIDVLNDNTDEIDKHFERTSIVLSVTDNNISVDATGPYYTVTNNNADTVQVLLEGNSMLLDPGETFKMNKAATETFTLEVTCASDVTVTYFQRNKDYVDGSLTSALSDYYDKSDTDDSFLKIEDFGDLRNEKNSAACTSTFPLEYRAYGNNIEEYRIYGNTEQPAGTVSPDAPKPVTGVGDIVSGGYVVQIVNNDTVYNVIISAPLYYINFAGDYIDYAKQKVIRKCGVITFDGSADEAWSNPEYHNYCIAVDNLGGGSDPHAVYEVYCDKLRKTSFENLGLNIDHIALYNGNLYVYFNSYISSVPAFKTYLASNPITVYYPMETETTEDITAPDLPTVSGINQIYVNTDVVPKNVVVGALMQYITIKDLNDTFPGLDNVYTKLEVNSMVNNLNAEVVTKAESVNDINHVNGNISLTLDDVPDGSNRKMEGLATESYVNSAIGNVNSFNVLVVQSLPASDIQQHTIYFVPKTPSENGDVYDEYMYINSAWEHIGTSDANLSNYYTKSEVNTAISNKADSTVLTAHTGNADIHVTAADKTAWNLIPKSKGELYPAETHSYQDFVIPILNIASTYSNEFFYGQIFLKRNNAAGKQMTIINLMCGKNYNEEKAVYYIDKTEMWTRIKPCSFVYNGKKMFGIHVNIVASDYNFLRVDARSTTDFGIITPVYIYNNNTSAVLNAEIYNSLTFFDGYNMPMNFYEIPQVIKSDGTATKLLSFSSVPASATATGTKGDISYDTNYLYMCTAANTWKKTAWDADVYSTTETVVGTYMGKPLYRKVVNCGALPNNTTKEVTHNISNINIITSISGTSWDSTGTTIPLPTTSSTSSVELYADKSKISITTTTDKSNLTNSNVIIEYTKTTDA